MKVWECTQIRDNLKHFYYIHVWRGYAMVRALYSRRQTNKQTKTNKSKNITSFGRSMYTHISILRYVTLQCVKFSELQTQ